jgi:hypothetical protein
MLQMFAAEGKAVHVTLTTAVTTPSLLCMQADVRCTAPAHAARATVACSIHSSSHWLGLTQPTCTGSSVVICLCKVDFAKAYDTPAACAQWLQTQPHTCAGQLVQAAHHISGMHAAVQGLNSAHCSQQLGRVQQSSTGRSVVICLCKVDFAKAYDTPPACAQWLQTRPHTCAGQLVHATRQVAGMHAADRTLNTTHCSQQLEPAGWSTASEHGPQRCHRQSRLCESL